MRHRQLYGMIGGFAVMALACSLAGQAQQTATQPVVPLATHQTGPIASATAMPTDLPITETPTPAASATAGAPADAILVDTFDQEVYQFKQKGNGELCEAIWTVLSQKAQDACSLKPGGTTIYLPNGTYALTQADNAPVVVPGLDSKDRLGLVPAGFPVISGQVTILGNGSTIQRSGPNKFGIFQVFVRGDLTLDSLTVTGGDTTSGAYSDADGGALEMMGGQVTLKHVTMSGNQGGSGGALEIANGSADIEDSFIRGNTAADQGGGIDSSGTLTIKNSVIAGNVAKADVFGGGGINNAGGKVTLDHSRVEGNTADEGGGIYNDGGTVSVINGSVIAANRATETDSDIPHGGGGINSIASAGDTAQVTISDSFILENHAEKTTGGGIYNQAALTVTNSVFAYNVAGAGGALFNDGEGSGSISGSCIIQNKVVGVTPAGLGSGIESGSDTPFDASKNWWGAASGPGPFGPGSGDSVTRNVNFDRFLREAPDICASELPTPEVTPAAP